MAGGEAGGRWCVPLVGGRGSGLGNELLAWALGYLMAREIGSRALAPAFGRKPRAYGLHCGTPLPAWLLDNLALRRSRRGRQHDLVSYGVTDAGPAL